MLQKGQNGEGVLLNKYELGHVDRSDEVAKKPVVNLIAVSS